MRCESSRNAALPEHAGCLGLYTSPRGRNLLSHTECGSPSLCMVVGGCVLCCEPQAPSSQYVFITHSRCRVHYVRVQSQHNTNEYLWDNCMAGELHYGNFLMVLSQLVSRWL
eukprot:scaffold145966_cov32-Tisochrysis_lutea.AAC.2